MCVYCDVCKENVVGNTKVPLLQIVPIRGDHRDYVCECYETSIYIHSSAAKPHIGYKNTISNRDNHSDTSTEKTRTPHPVMNNQQYYTNRRWAVYLHG